MFVGAYISEHHFDGSGSNNTHCEIHRKIFLKSIFLLALVEPSLIKQANGLKLWAFIQWVTHC